MNKNWKASWERIGKHISEEQSLKFESRCNKIKLHVETIDLFIDCGPGLIGSEAWYIKELYPQAEIIGFEPQVDRFIYLKENRYPGSLYNCAVSHINGRTNGYMGHKSGKSDFWLHGSETLLEEGAYQMAEIESITIDSFLAVSKKKYDNVFIWADVEGSESDIISGANHSLETNIRGLNLEISKMSNENPNIVCPPAVIIENLRGKGFKTVDKVKIKGNHKDILFIKEK